MNSSVVPSSAVTLIPSAVAAVLPFAKATDEQVATFCDAILLGLPTHKILPGSISDLKASGGISAEQLALIKAARKDHEENTEADRKVLFRLARVRRVRGARFNRDGNLIGLRFGDRLTSKTNTSSR